LVELAEAERIIEKAPEA